MDIGQKKTMKIEVKMNIFVNEQFIFAVLDEHVYKIVISLKKIHRSEQV